VSLDWDDETTAVTHDQLVIRLASIGLNVASLQRYHTMADPVSYLELLAGRASAYFVADQPAFSDCLEFDHLVGESPAQQQPRLFSRIKLTQLYVSFQLRLYALCRCYLKSCEQARIPEEVLAYYRTALDVREEESKGIYKPISSENHPNQGIRATFVGPIKVVIDPVKGRKVVVSRDVQAGELLLVEPPMIDLTYNGAPDVSLVSISASGDMASKPSPHQASWAVHRIMDDPSIGQCVHSLAPDPRLDSSNPGLSDQERLRIFHKPSEIEVGFWVDKLGEALSETPGLTLCME
jgi:hypothetical protein